MVSEECSPEEKAENQEIDDELKRNSLVFEDGVLKRVLLAMMEQRVRYRQSIQETGDTEKICDLPMSIQVFCKNTAT